MADAEKVVAEQDAAFAEAGVDTTVGAAADLKAESTLNLLLNGLDIENQARSRARSFTREAANRRTQGEMDRFGADSNAQSTMVSGYASAVSSGASIAASRYKPGK